MKSDSHDLGLDASDANYTLLREVKYAMVFTHPEAFVPCKDGMELFQSPPYQCAVKAVIIDEAPPQSKVRVIFATVAMWMGVDIPSIRHVIHVGPPRTIREYFQEKRTGKTGWMFFAPSRGWEDERPWERGCGTPGHIAMVLPNAYFWIWTL